MPSPGRSTFVIDALGVHVLCRAEDVGTAEAVRRAWVDAVVTDPSPREPAASLTVGLGPGTDVSGSDLDEVLHHLSPAITQRAIGANRGGPVMLHAAALADPATGATAVLVAASGTGKTTACRTLGRSFAYLSDETAAITHDGVVLPYRKPLSIVQDGPLKAQCAPSELGMLMTERECRLGALLVIDRLPGHPVRPEVNPLPHVDAIAALAPQSSYLPSLERPLHRLAEVCELAGGAHHVAYREAASLQGVLEDLLGGVG